MLYRIIILSLLMINLTGCIATAVGTAAVAGGAVAGDPRKTSTVFGDQNISQHIAITSNSNPAMKQNTNLQVTTYNGVVLLVGQVPNDKLRQQIVNIAQNTPNVKMIYNEISIGKPTSASTHMKDTWITTKVHSKLLGALGLGSNDFKVVTEDGTVYLMGLVSKPQGELAAISASNVSGVKKVVQLFQYQAPKHKKPSAQVITPLTDTNQTTNANHTANTTPQNVTAAQADLPAAPNNPATTQNPSVPQ